MSCRWNDFCTTGFAGAFFASTFGAAVGAFWASTFFSALGAGGGADCAFGADAGVSARCGAVACCFAGCAANFTVSTLGSIFGVRSPGKNRIASACMNSEMASAQAAARLRCQGSGSGSKKTTLSAVMIDIMAVSP
jgi:hypothetical protein